MRSEGPTDQTGMKQAERDAIDHEFKRAQEGLERAGRPLARTILTPAGRAGVEQVIAAVKMVQDLVGVRLAPAAGLSVGFNALDGD